ncbi:MAG: hypothetical protein DRJ62_06455 [Thermoprotei archaeon]|nr:MAG: hypothetical protein DRJ62_06455 [Thermoprotei archaeon]
MLYRPLWVVGSGYTLGVVGERFRVEVRGGARAFEVAARRTYCVVLDGEGSLSSSAIGLARKYGVPLVLVNGLDVEGFTWISHGKSVEPLIYQVQAHLNVREHFSRIFLEALREGFRGKLQVELEGGLSEVRSAISRVIAERWGSSSKAKAEYARTLLAAICWAALYRAGLNPDVGFLHDKLCFDLACEFEHIVVLEALKAPDLEGAELRRAVAKLVDSSLQATIQRATLSSRPHSLLWHVNAQARSLASTLRSGLFSYKPFREG